MTSTARKAMLTLAAACAAALGAAAPASAEFGVASFRTSTHTPHQGPEIGGGEVPPVPTIPGRHHNQAGAHADATVRFRMRTKDDAFGIEVPDGALKDVVLDLPAGFAGDPQAVPQCTPAQFNGVGGGCPPSTQVGIAITEIPVESLDDRRSFFRSPVYNLVPSEGEPAAFGFHVTFVPVKVSVHVRSDGDYGLRTTVSNISTGATVFGQELTLWGVPADPVHDWQRAMLTPIGSLTWGVPAGVAPRPFLTLPPTCPGPMTNVFRVRAWRSEAWVTTTEVTTNPDTNEPEGPQNCEHVPFDARLSMQPSDTRAGQPAPYTAKVTAAYNAAANGIGNAHVKDVTVTLPEGTSIAPPSADGLAGCTPEQLKLGSTEDVACPEASKIGDVRIDTPVLPGPLTGHVYLRQPTREQLFAIAIVAKGFGVNVKLPGEIYPNHVTGQIVSEFRNNPQLPFTELTVRFKGGPRAPLTNPQTCGQYTTTTTITSWAGHSQTSADTFTIDQGPDGGPCQPLGFSPSFTAGMLDAAAGRSSTFSLTFGRSDGDQDLSSVTVQMPPGLTGKLALVEQCPDVLANAGACDEGSRIGSVTAGAGAGSIPFFLPGRVYMTGPYKGAPLGLSIVVPAVAGPFDLGTVVVRAAVFVDPVTAALRVVADPMPTILEGVPLRVRTVNVRIDKPGFMINPTGCKRKDVTGTIVSSRGATAAVGSKFVAVNCRSLPLRQRLVLAVGARGATGRDRRTPLTATLRQPAGVGNLKRVEVVLPKTLNGRLDVIQRDKACSMEQFAADRCPNPIGEGVATTPLLRDPLRGPAYFVYNPARRLPDIVVRLRGQVDIDLVGKVTIPRDLTLRTSFDTVPDVPVTMFRLRLTGDQRQGPVGVVTNLCTKAGRSGRARIALVGHNGRRVDVRQKLRINGCGRAQRRSAKRQAKRQRAKTSAAVRAAVRAVEADARR